MRPAQSAEPKRETVITVVLTVGAESLFQARGLTSPSRILAPSQFVKSPKNEMGGSWKLPSLLDLAAHAVPSHALLYPSMSTFMFKVWVDVIKPDLGHCSQRFSLPFCRGLAKMRVSSTGGCLKTGAGKRNKKTAPIPARSLPQEFMALIRVKVRLADDLHPKEVALT